MSFCSDGNPFDEYDPPYCRGCTRGNSYEECKLCVKLHEETEVDLDFDDLDDFDAED